VSISVSRPGPVCRLHTRDTWDRCTTRKKSVHSQTGYFVKRYLDTLHLSSADRRHLTELQKQAMHSIRRQNTGRKYMAHYR
jgi:hypothetical protein